MADRGRSSRSDVDYSTMMLATVTGGAVVGLLTLMPLVVVSVPAVLAGSGDVGYFVFLFAMFGLIAIVLGAALGGICGAISCLVLRLVPRLTSTPALVVAVCTGVVSIGPVVWLSTWLYPGWQPVVIATLTILAVGGAYLGVRAIHGRPRFGKPAAPIH